MATSLTGLLFAADDSHSAKPFHQTNLAAGTFFKIKFLPEFQDLLSPQAIDKRGQMKFC